MKLNLKLAALLLVALPVFAGDATERQNIREGDSEGSVLVKIGRPDSESLDTSGGVEKTVKRWIYLPAPNDSDRITTITIRQGKVITVDREFVRHGFVR